MYHDIYITAKVSHINVITVHCYYELCMRGTGHSYIFITFLSVQSSGNYHHNNQLIKDSKTIRTFKQHFKNKSVSAFHYKKSGQFNLEKYSLKETLFSCKWDRFIDSILIGGLIVGLLWVGERLVVRVGASFLKLM